MTIGEGLRQMSDDDLGAFLDCITDCCYSRDCENCPMFRGHGNCSPSDWLKEEVQGVVFDQGADDV